MTRAWTAWLIRRLLRWETYRSCAARATPRRGGVVAGGEVNSVDEAGDVVGFAK
jgi:hypothetical protein